MKDTLKWLRKSNNELMAFKVASYLISGLSHEINNIFTACFGYIFMAKNYIATNPEKALEKLNEAENSLTRASKLIARFHSISSKNPINPGKIIVIPILKDIISQTNPQNIQIVLADQEWRPVINGSEELFRCAIQNALTNALDGSEENFPVTVTVAPSIIDDILYCGIAISNQGQISGVKDFGQLFIPYYTTKAGASGLGLTIIRSVMNQHQGKIEFTSSKGITEIKLLFPIESVNNK